MLIENLQLKIQLLQAQLDDVVTGICTNAGIVKRGDCSVNVATGTVGEVRRQPTEDANGPNKDAKEPKSSSTPDSK